MRCGRLQSRLPQPSRPPDLVIARNLLLLSNALLPPCALSLPGTPLRGCRSRWTRHAGENYGGTWARAELDIHGLAQVRFHAHFLIYFHTHFQIYGYCRSHSRGCGVCGQIGGCKEMEEAAARRIQSQGQPPGGG